MYILHVYNFCNVYCMLRMHMNFCPNIAIIIAITLISLFLLLHNEVSFVVTTNSLTIFCRSQAWPATRAQCRTLPVHEGSAQHSRTKAYVTRPE